MNVSSQSVQPMTGLSATPDPAGEWQQLGQQPVVVLVGVTGVGKSTALSALTGLRLLPDRRDVTDAVMILPLAGQPVHDREERFALTARYRELHPGGMAQALGSLYADPTHWSGPLVFDGLRGAPEVGYAAQHFPEWRFVSLHAPDAVRVRRLLGRGDTFDQVGHVDQVRGAESSDLRSTLGDLKGVGDVFSPAELDDLAALVDAGSSASEILAKTRIVVSERRNYDPQAARRVLADLPQRRHLELDTVRLSPGEVASSIRRWLP
ncbi:AAA family ATPase [Deinococcus ruber]|nr:AAA family ATPase [Deinococcus ruber]